jgi:glucose/arabinose dehydrogenase/regulation of enolase protein 1 (concanavalin A-like superfamily)
MSSRTGVFAPEVLLRTLTTLPSMVPQRANKLWHRLTLASLAFLLASGSVLIGRVAPAAAANAAFPDLPAGFAKVELAKGLHNPAAIAFAPNGDIYIAEQKGLIKLYRAGAIQPTPVLSLTVDSGTETGILGLALDPNFATNGYMYVAWTTPDPLARLSRFTVTGGGTTASPASELILWHGNEIQAAHHSINDVHIGPDGKLWFSVGDNDPNITNGETLTNAYGKILRINLDGSIPSDNPFVNVPTAVPAIYAYGLRNPFRFTFLPDGRAMTEDTGSDFWEEMDTIQPGANYGWDFVEGDCGSCGYVNPAYAYGHLPVDGAASAMAAYSGNVFPSQYANTVFFGDYNRVDIEAVNFDPTYTTEISDTVFDSSVGTIADLQEGPDGDLYYVSIFEGQFWKIYPTGPLAPTAAASASPNAGLSPLTAQFSSAGSSDPYNLPLTYSWDFGDGSPVSNSPNPSHLYGSNGTYTAALTVSNGTTTNTATTNVVVGQSPPVASIDSPVLSTYNAGSTISFSGSATDAVDGTLAASDFSWQVDFMANGLAKPSYLYEVPGPFYGPVSGVSSGSFQIPTDNSNVPSSFYRITMTATDSLGLSTVVTRDIHPTTTSWTVNSSVAGAKFWVDGFLKTNSFTTSDVVGVQHVLIGVPDQVIGGTRYRLHGWADGSGQTDKFTSGPSASTYTVVEDPVTSTVPAGWTSTDIGAPLMAGTTNYSTADQTFYLDGSGTDVYNTNDQFHYTYMNVTGDGTIVARLRYQTNTNPSAKAGVMFKETATTGANYVAALVYPDVSPNTPNTNGIDCTPDGCAAPLPPIDPAVGKGVKMQYSPTGGISPAAPLANYLVPNKWLKLQRVGNNFTAYQSVDGVIWNLLGKKTFTMAGAVTVGLFVTSHNTGQYSNVAFDNVSVSGNVTWPPDFSIGANPLTVPAVAGNSASTAINTAIVNGGPDSISLSTSGLPAGVTAGFSPTSVATGSSSTLTFNVAGSVAAGTYPITVTGTSTSATHSTLVSLTVTPLPAPWLDTDVGAPSPAGSASYAAGVYTVNGAGADIFGASDQFNYVYQNTTGNGTIIAHVISQSSTGSSNSKVGVIWKASTTAGSPYILIESGPTGLVKVQYNFNGSISTPATYAFPNLWMKMVRSGSNFSAYVSPDGLTWTAIVVNKNLPTITTAATVGIYECSHKPGVLGTATFDNVSFTPGP